MATLKKRRKLPQAEFTTPARDNQVRLRGATPAIPAAAGASRAVPAVPRPRGIPAAPRAPQTVPPIPRDTGRPDDPGAQGRANAAAKKAENEIRRLMKRKK